MSTIHILIADTDPVRLEELSSVLGKAGDLVVDSAVSRRETAIKQLTDSVNLLLVNPDILKGHTVLRFIRSVQAKVPHARVMYLLNDMPSDQSIISDIKGGIRGYLLSTTSPSLIARAVRAVHSGEIWAERRILEKAIAHPILLPDTLQAHVPDLPPLTARELEMLSLVLEGASNKEIADRSSISERTVKTHLYRVYRKLNVKSRAKAIALLSQAR